MNTEVEELLRDGMERFTAQVHAPAGLAGGAGRLRRQHRRRLAARAAVACGAAAAIAAGVTVAATGGSGAAQAQTVAYVTKRVENALATEKLVFVGRSDGKMGDYVTWAYGPRSRWEEFSGSKPYWAQGTALIGGKLVGAYVTYFDRRYSLSPLGPQETSACSATDALSMGAPVIPTTHWTAFIDATLACGAASVSGHVWIDGMETTKITGKPITVRLSAGYSKVVKEKFATARWAVYVNPTTYLPVRMDGSTETFGGSAGGFTSSFVTNVRWLLPTRANIAQALVTIPPGFHRFYGPAGDQ
ncbi:MAG TPA: hypothetical protein VMC83_39645 [Streptosporangiaceae bacterium]|nr:hypothetical protein [Streptosporangiaceae bacterium]